MLECLYLILDVDYMSRYLVSDFVETALSPSLSRSILYLHTLHSLIHTFTYLSMLTKFKVPYSASAQWYLCVLLNWLKLNKMSFNLQHFTLNLRYQLSSCFSFMINLYFVCMDFFRTEVEFWLVLLGPSTGKVLDSWCLFLISENKICWLDVYFNIQDFKIASIIILQLCIPLMTTPPKKKYINQKIPLTKILHSTNLKKKERMNNSEV